MSQAVEVRDLRILILYELHLTSVNKLVGDAASPDALEATPDVGAESAITCSGLSRTRGCAVESKQGLRYLVFVPCINAMLCWHQRIKFNGPRFIHSHGGVSHCWSRRREWGLRSLAFLLQ